MSTLHAVLVLAAEEAEPSKTPFYVMGGVLAGWAVVLSAIGLTSPSFPRSQGTTRAVMGVSAVLVGAAMVAAVISG
jgi:uncharacterized membrane protein YcjF (UPF0283 family)